VKAAYINRFGGPEVVEFGEVPEPPAGPDAAMVEVAAASVNRADHLVRAGTYGGAVDFPLVLGRDFSGVVSRLPADGGDLRIGDRVFGVLETGREGAYAQRVAIAPALLARLPEAIPFLDGAALALAGLTALVAIEETLRVQSGETVLIQGGAGGVAGIAIQIAKHLGARVITTASPANLDYVRTLGADEAIDYTRTDFTSLGRRCDAVFDTVGGDVALRAFDVLKPGGRAAFIASGSSAPPSPRAGLVSLRPNVARGRAPLERLLGLVQTGAVISPAMTIFPLAEARRAHEAGASRHQRGKFVLDVSGAR
jgi:NADPH:quinone reductase-like Zn-dependent oxidoreductase